MKIMMRLGLCSLLAAIGMAAACTTNDTADDRECVSGEQEACTCDDGSDGFQTCNATGSGFSECDCTGGTGGTGGSGGTTGGTGGTTGGAGGTTGGTGGIGGTAGGGAGGLDAGPDATEPDATIADGGLVCDPAALDGSADTACNNCLYQQCCNELWACGDDVCNNPGDAGVTESELMIGCLVLAMGDAGPGALTQGDVASCAATSGLLGGEVSATTLALTECIVGTADSGPNCREECVY